MGLWRLAAAWTGSIRFDRAVRWGIVAVHGPGGDRDWSALPGSPNIGSGTIWKEFAPVQVAITCRHGSIKPDLNEYITRKSEKLLTYFERVTQIQVTLDFLDGRVRAEMLVDAEHKHNFVAHAEGDNATATFDGVLHKMEQQIRKYKEKVQDHRRDRPLNEMLESGGTETESE
jgi:putative sigma-54 modulation protein